jgi:hypothetical protein
MFVPKTKPDLYQQEHPIESEDLILAKLDELEAELAKIADKDKATYLQALEKCPQLVSNKEKLQFLRCEVFNADVSDGFVIGVCLLQKRTNQSDVHG